MWALVKLLIFGHIHKWKVIEKCPHTEKFEGTVVKRAMHYTSQCEICGRLRGDII